MRVLKRRGEIFIYKTSKVLVKRLVCGWEGGGLPAIGVPSTMFIQNLQVVIGLEELFLVVSARVLGNI